MACFFNCILLTLWYLGANLWNKYQLLKEEGEIVPMFFRKAPDKQELPVNSEAIFSPVTGVVIPLEKVSDPTFAQKILGDGLAIYPEEGKIYSPVDGEVTTLTDTLHAVCLTSKQGAELLIHVGRDTVTLNGRPFTCHVKEGDKIRKGQLLLEFDLEAIDGAGLDLTTPVIVANSDDYELVKAEQTEITPNDILLTLHRK